MLGGATPAAAAEWPEGIPAPLSAVDATRYRHLLDDAEAGRKPSSEAMEAVENPILLGHVKGLYYLHGGHAGYDELVGWLRKYNDLPEAMGVYQLAQNARVTSKKVVSKVKRHGKTVTRVRYVRRIDSRLPAPPVPAVVAAREARREALARAREAEYDGLDAATAAKRRAVLGGVWLAMKQGHWDRALALLEAPGAREAAGVPRWQAAMVAVADHDNQKRQYAEALTVAKRAAEISGPDRDAARWLAGIAAWRLGNTELAAEQWKALVAEQPEGDSYVARAAWWGARAANKLGERGESRRLLKVAARDITSFYGQLALAQLGDGSVLEWKTPRAESADVKALWKIPAAQRGLALAQLGRVAMGQQEFRLAGDNIPYQATSTLAALGVRLGLPALALQAGKDLQEQGHLWLGALYPLPEWKPPHETVEPPLMLAIMRQESAFHPNIGSAVGAQGLMQLMPATARVVARMLGRPAPGRDDLHDPATNLALAQAYLRYLGGKLDNNLMLVIAAYNGGPGNVRKWLDRGWVPDDDPVLFLESIPFKETKDYVEKVLANLWMYEQRMGGGSSGSLVDIAHGRWPKSGVAWNIGEKVANR
jgi:soluble lytic murein transglycosylase-like protein